MVSGEFVGKKLRLGVLASGTGTNLQAIIENCRKGTLDAEIVLVVSNNPDAGALQKAQRAGLRTLCIDHRLFKKRGDFDLAVIERLREAEVDLVVLAGFMRLLSDEFLQAFPYRIINIHPALLPAFPGLNAQRQALEYGVRVAGCTVHFLDAGVDTGPIILQATVPVLDDDTEETLARRILAEEHRIYPLAIRLFAEGRLHIRGRRVRIEPPLESDVAP
jgi:phosphoribosylglycinamide formyltransferase-1